MPELTLTETDRLLCALQLMIDGGKRGVADASLGSARVLIEPRRRQRLHVTTEGAAHYIAGRGAQMIRLETLEESRRSQYG
jgi:hypothetical protein